MLQNHFKTAWRNLTKNKTFSFINVLGLTVGLTSFLLIALYIFDELTFDRSHKNAASTYRLISKRTFEEGKQVKIPGAGYLVSEKMKTDFPEVKNIARVDGWGRVNVWTLENTNVYYDEFTLASEGFLKVFDFPLTQGDRNTALSAPHSVIITEETAKKLFASTDVLGKSIKTDWDSIPFKITGVLKNFPANSHLSFNVLFSESSLTKEDYADITRSGWDSDGFVTYVQLAPNTDVAQFSKKLNGLVDVNKTKRPGTSSSFLLQPLTAIHFYSGDIEGASGKKGNITYIYVFSLIAVFVLFIACINYMNLTTARFANRSKEIAVRKVTGASRKTLTGQFLAEAFTLTLIAFFVSLVLAKLLLPVFNAFTEKQLSLGINTDYRIWIGVGLIIIITGLLSGIYPALFQAGQKPLFLIKQKTSNGNRSISVRQSLVVFQFVLSVIMIVATLVVYLQMKYINTKDMGFNKDQLIVVDINSGDVRRSAETIKNEFAKLRQVKDVAISSRVPGEWKSLPQGKVTRADAANAQPKDIFFLGVDGQFIHTYQVKLLNGRNFSENGNADSSSVIINEMAARELGITNAEGQQIRIPAVNYGLRTRPLEKPLVASVIGIVKDFNFQSLHKPLAPMMLGFQKNPIQNIDYFTVRTVPGDVSATLKQMDAILRTIDPTHLLEYHFLDKQWDTFYREDRVRGTIFLIMAILSVLIACLGLFGLATYAAEQRIKEIGIRKVLGANVQGIVAMLSKDFLKLVLIASLIAFPVAWWLMQDWLSSFAYRISIKWWMFAAAGITALFIALATISYQAIKAAVANPVKSLRTE